MCSLDPLQETMTYSSAVGRHSLPFLFKGWLLCSRTHLFPEDPKSSHWSVSRNKDPAPMTQLSMPLTGQPAAELPWDCVRTFWQLNSSLAQTWSLLPVSHTLMPRLSLINVPHGNLYLSQESFWGEEEKKKNLSGEPYLRCDHYYKPGSGSRIASHIGASYNCPQDSTLWAYAWDKYIVISVCQLIYKCVENGNDC